MLHVALSTSCRSNLDANQSTGIHQNGMSSCVSAAPAVSIVPPIFKPPDKGHQASSLNREHNSAVPTIGRSVAADSFSAQFAVMDDDFPSLPTTSQQSEGPNRQHSKWSQTKGGQSGNVKVGLRQWAPEQFHLLHSLPNVMLHSLCRAASKFFVEHPLHSLRRIFVI